MTIEKDEPLLRTRDVTRTFGGVPVVSSVSIDVYPGVTAVIGPNGSGKSTLQRVLAGDLEPTGGNVEYCGPNVGRPIGYLPQHSPFRGSFTVRETLAFYARLADGSIDGRLEAVGLADAAERRVDALSEGMRRLLGIAQASIGDPPVVLLDEPASGLDPTMRERAFGLVAETADDVTAVVVTTHALDLVDRYADRIIVLDRGAVVTAGEPTRLAAEHGVNDVSELYADVVGTERESVHVTGVTR